MVKARSASVSYHNCDDGHGGRGMTPVAGPGWILREEILSPNLQARFCKLYPADFSFAVYLFLCS